MGAVERVRSGEEKARDAELAAVQAALAAEHAAVYGYGVVGGRIGKADRAQARECYEAHRARRDVLRRSVRDLGASPRPAAAGYALPFPVEDPAAARRLAAELEDRVAAVYSDLVRAATGGARGEAARALREAAVRAARWRAGSVAFPGLTERPARKVSTDGPGA
ncbi:ferritin-like domain-containing protein [Streptomyces sp. NA04227]|uniref:ferritin-like domain-containing protein n=1 Tax=Streptomyces sp. NA04227 TaxID=2742136 RepID=UPI001590D181|nr:ferritin-like domain-containing protein [Streptomyces sp. NA04227]QKW11186.1 ferritin-like domain-containing protein [Streptomyces sp. NA04227]